MPGVARRSKPLKARTTLAEVTDFNVANPADGDLLVYDGDAGLWTNLKALTGNYSIDGALTAGQATITGALAVGGNQTIAGTLGVTGGVSLAAGLTVAGASSLAAAALSGALTVAGSTTLAGALTGAGFSFSGSGTIAGDLTVVGTLNAGTLVLDDITVDDITATGNIILAGTGYFGGNVEMAGNLLVSGNVGGAYIGSTGNIGAAGDLEIAGTALLGAFLEITALVDQDTLVAESVIYANRYSAPLILRGERLDTPGDDDNPPVTTTVDMATLDPDGRVVLHYQGTDTFRTASNAIEFWDGSAWVAVASLPTTTSNYYGVAWNATAAAYQARVPTVWFALDEDLAFMLDDDNNVIQDEPPADA